MNRDLYLTKHSTRRRQISMPPAIFKTAFEAIEWPQTHASDPRLHQFRQEIVSRRIYVPGNTKWIPRYSVKCSIFVSDFNRICIFWTDFYNKYPASNVLGIRPVEAVLINTDGHRNVTKLVGTFRHYANAPKKVSRRIGSYILRNIKEVSLGLSLIIFF